MSGTLGNTSSWAPIDETPTEMLSDSVSLISATTINAVAYGVVLTLYCICVYALIQQYNEKTRRKQAIFIGLYISVMFGLGTVYCAVNSRLSQLEYVNYRNFPGGPNNSSLYLFSTPINISGAAAMFVTTWMNDALLVWRLSVVYRGSPFATPIIGAAIIAYLGTFAMGMVTLIESIKPNLSVWSAINVKFALAYYAMTVAYTVVITALMAARILLQRQRFIKATGQQGHGSQYLSIAAMIIESSALYTIWGVIFLGLYIVNNPIQFVFLGSLSEVQIAAPLLIMYRVSIGKAWKTDTSQTLSLGGDGNRAQHPLGTFAQDSSSGSHPTLNNIPIVVEKTIASKSYGHDEV